MSVLKNLDLITCSHHRLNSNCRVCGVYMHVGLETYKSCLYQCNEQASNKRHLKSLRKTASRFRVGREKFAYSEAVYNFLEKVVGKFEFSVQTLALGVYLFNELLQRKSSSKSDYVAEMEFYSSVCLLVAAKAIQLDKNIPYISRYQRYAEKSHTKEQYERSEVDIMDEFEFNLQVPTFATFVSHYLANGILFEDDYYNKNRIFVLEEKVRGITLGYIKNGAFVTQDQQKLAARVILQARKEVKLKWNPIIQEYSLLPLAQFQETQILRQIQVHHSFTVLPSLGKGMHNQTNIPIDRPFKKSSSSLSRRELSIKVKEQLLKGKQSLKSIPLLSSLHLKSLNKID